MCLFDLICQKYGGGHERAAQADWFLATTEAMIYEVNSERTIFSLERKTSNLFFLIQPSELNAQ